jgi:sialate O-acetylesterase
VAFYFGRKLNEELKVPIGLIYSGGTPIEVCVPADAYKTDPTLAEFPAKFAAREAAFPKVKEDWDKKMAQWEAKKAEILATQPAATPGKGLPYPPAAIYPPSQTVGTIYNSTIAPLRRVAMAGVIWYQGESDVGDAAGYAKQFPALIRAWRKNLGQEDLTFLFVQIADGVTVSTANDPNRPCPMSELRHAQTSALALPRTAMVVTLDLGEPNNAHPKYKQPVADRLARAALAIKYGRDIPNYSSPTFDSLKVDGDKLIVKFKHAEGGLVVKGDKPSGFIIAGSDGKFFHAEARVDGDGVVLANPNVPKPVSVRYSWGLVPPYSLYNKVDLPLGVFQAGEIDLAK